jgi:hypothetical protein
MYDKNLTIRGLHDLLYLLYDILFSYCDYL